VDGGLLGDLDADMVLRHVMILLSEYVLTTGDQSVVPGLRRLALLPEGQGK
jgi:hypothetical protein